MRGAHYAILRFDNGDRRDSIEILAGSERSCRLIAERYELEPGDVIEVVSHLTGRTVVKYRRVAA